MNSLVTRTAWLALLTGSVTLTGCATKGFVRNELDSVREEMRAGDDRLATELETVSNSAAEAMARAETALQTAGEARDLALGKVGYEEVASYSVTFARDSFEIDGAAMSALEEAASKIQGHPEFVVDIYGFTDATGPSTYNLLLGQKRAEAVLRFLLERSQSSAQRFAAVSYGEEKPVSGSDAENRRVIVSLIQKTAKPQAPAPESSDGKKSDEEITMLHP